MVGLEIRSIVSMRAFSAARRSASGSAASGSDWKARARTKHAAIRKLFRCSRRTLLHDLRIAQIETIAGIEILAIVHNDFQSLSVRYGDVDRLRRLVAGDFGFQNRVIIGQDR